MEYDLLKHRGFMADDHTPSMKLLYFYSKYRKDRENAKPQGNGKTIRVGG